jgi:glycosyltransferase involved in cell wall biosynthesis
MRATVIIPTHDHGPLIEHAVASATGQTERDIEILIVGDGVPDEARRAIERVVASDSRIRFLDRPKGPGHGFRHRDDAIGEARGDNILYLGDDDIWFPEHVTLLCQALEEADFVASFALSLTRTDVRMKVAHDLAQPAWRKHLRDGRSMVSLAVVGHTRELYSRLETGWRRDPALYAPVWDEFARHAVEMSTVPRATAVILPETKRTHMTADERAAELSEVAALVQRASGRLQLIDRMLEHETRRWSQRTLDFERLRERLAKKKKPRNLGEDGDRVERG